MMRWQHGTSWQHSASQSHLWSLHCCDSQAVNGEEPQAALEPIPARNRYATSAHPALTAPVVSVMQHDLKATLTTLEGVEFLQPQATLDHYATGADAQVDNLDSYQVQNTFVNIPDPNSEANLHRSEHLALRAQSCHPRVEMKMATQVWHHAEALAYDEFGEVSMPL